MRSKLLLPLIVLLCSAGLAQAAHHGDWKPLWNGKDLSEFQQFNGTGKYWIEDDSIVGQTREGSPNSFLCTRKLYGDFELKFEVLVHNSLNSGVQIRSRLNQDEDNYGRVFGPQVEIEAGPGQAGHVWAEATGLGWLSEKPRDKAYSHDVFKNNEWNEYHIVAKGPTITISINGEKIDEVTNAEVHEMFPSGFIGLQVHSIKRGKGPYEVRWRNLKIKEL